MLRTTSQIILEAMSPHDMKKGTLEHEMWFIGGRHGAYNITDPKDLTRLIKHIQDDLHTIGRVKAGKMNEKTAKTKRRIPNASEEYLRETLDKLKAYKPETSEAVDKNKVLQWHQEKMRRKAVDKEKRDKEKAELDSIKMTDEEILKVLQRVKNDTFRFLQNPEICRKLLKMGLLRLPTTVEKNSSFGQMYYLSKKGEKFLAGKE